MAVVNRPAGEPQAETRVDWAAAERQVRRLRQQIFTASRNGDLRKVRSLQKLMLRSWCDALVGVRVTEINDGRKTAGIDRTGRAGGG
jgi:RNA-directed DNA polymerase